MYREKSSMNPIRYADLPFTGNVVMSLCHSWFGFERSKNRTFGLRFRRRFFVGFVARFASFSVLRTVSGDACTHRVRFRNWLIRLIPNEGCFFLAAAI